MTEEALLVVVRRELGNISDVTDEDLMAYISQALSEYSASCVNRTQYYITEIVKDQSEYTVEANITGVLKVIFNTRTSETQNIYSGYVDSQRTVFEPSTFDNPSLNLIWYQKLDAQYNQPSYDWTYYNGTIYLSPVPSQAGYMAYEATITLAIALADLSLQNINVLKKYIKGKALQQIGLGRLKPVSSIPTLSGEIKFASNRPNEMLFQQGIELEKSFYNSMGGGKKLMKPPLVIG